ncbi:MAG: hypothetical protein J7K77_04695 [Dehalococcoidales bacterium]|nr:hypothetical protein [Dehalococcoidales bacterium]
MRLSKATLKRFNATDYKATIQLTGSHQAYLEDITVARNLPESAMTPGRKLVVTFFDEHNPKEAVITAVFS